MVWGRVGYRKAKEGEGKDGLELTRLEPPASSCSKPLFDPVCSFSPSFFFFFPYFFFFIRGVCF